MFCTRWRASMWPIIVKWIFLHLQGNIKESLSKINGLKKKQHWKITSCLQHQTDQRLRIMLTWTTVSLFVRDFITVTICCILAIIVHLSNGMALSFFFFLCLHESDGRLRVWHIIWERNLPEYIYNWHTEWPVRISRNDLPLKMVTREWSQYFLLEIVCLST